MTGSPLAIKVRDAGKRFVKYEDTPMLVSRLLQLRNRTRRSDLWALRGASFEVAQGECIGVIGRNGSGKSTLLQMLAGVTAPTEGTVTVHGRVAPLISVGVGFHPELSGRENVYVNGMILGLTRGEIDDRLDEIVAFAEIGDFLDTPVKFYSSGMFVRLGFAVSAIAEPDVMLIDEVLAVGDLAFQLKCFERLERLRASGATIVIVTHNLNAVRRICDRALVIHDGELRHDGDTVDSLSLYHELLGESREDPDEFPSRNRGSSINAAQISDLRLLGPDGQPSNHFSTGDTVTLNAVIEVWQIVPAAMIGMVIVTEGGVHAAGERWALNQIDGFDGTGPLRVEMSFAVPFATGSYSLHLGMGSSAHESIASPPAPVLFYVTGKPTVTGVVDMETRFSTSSD